MDTQNAILMKLIEALDGAGFQVYSLGPTEHYPGYTISIGPKETPKLDSEISKSIISPGRNFYKGFC
jgi:hypothetical protein